MGEFLFYLVLAFALERAQLVMTMHNYGTEFNGLGAVELALERRGPAPGVYRVLVPWVMGIGQALRLPKLELYEVIKILLSTLALWAVGQAWGLQVALLTAALLPVTFLFDYWDWAVELGSIALAMTGRMDLALYGMVLHAYSRETFVLNPLAYYLVTGDVWFAIILFITGATYYVFVQIAQGRHKLYCDRFMWRQNLVDLAQLWQARPAFLAEITLAILLSVAVVVAAVQGVPGWPVAALLVIAGWIFGRAIEVRLFAAALPWVAVVIGSLL